jgi:hypothetical protein
MFRGDNYQIAILILIAGLLSACGSEKVDDASDANTMCYEVNTEQLRLWCYSDDLHQCEDDGRKSLATYPDGETCREDMDTVLNDWANTGILSPGPNSNEVSSSDGSPAGGSGDASACYTSEAMPYGDIQIDSFCQTACVYVAAGQPSDAESTCSIINGFGVSSSACPYCKPQ